ncbi:WD40 repeat domain-containing protein [Streptomyces sp. NPDC102360]|uniref:WD40 repeat domain-containing protein n=1 Tax=Streptomyces sp. NPDC102360 TaxID=3366160 RepID=UPI00381F4DB1
MGTSSEIVDTTPAQELLDWVADGSSRLCRVTGARGSGKSHMLARFLADWGDGPGTTVHATVPARGLDVDGTAWELGRQLGYGPQPAHRLLKRVADDPRPLLLVVPDLHLARGPETVVGSLLAPLLRLEHVRMAIETADEALFPGEAKNIGAKNIDLRCAVFEPPQPQAGFAALLASVPRTADGRADWVRAPRQVCEQILDQAPDHDAVQELLSEPGFLLHGSAAAISASLTDPDSPAPPSLRAVWPLAAPQLSAREHGAAQRAAFLHTAALTRDADLATALRPLAMEYPLPTVWARSDLPVTALAALADGTVAAAAPPGTPHVLDPATGRSTGTLPAPRTARPSHMAADRLLLDDRGTLLPATPDAPVAAEIAAYHGQAALGPRPVLPTALGSDPRATTAVIGDTQGTVHVWPLTTFRSLPRAMRLHEAPVSAATCLRLVEDDIDLVFSAATDGTVRLWAVGSDPMPGPIEQRPALVTALAAAGTPAGPVLATAWDDAQLHLTHVSSGRTRALPLLQQADALALTPDGLLTVGGADITYALRLPPEGLWS